MSSPRALNTAARQLSRSSSRQLSRTTQPRLTRTIATYETSKNNLPTVQYSSRHRTSTWKSQPFSTLKPLRKEEADLPSGIPPPRDYGFAEISDLSSAPSPNRIIIDVREPSELLTTGRIPGARNIPLSSSPDAYFLSAEDFEDRFGFARPGEADEVIFYCKAGVRSRQAAALAGQARPMFGGKIGKYDGSWLDWEKNGGKVEKEGESHDQQSAPQTDVSAAGGQTKSRP